MTAHAQRGICDARKEEHEMKSMWCAIPDEKPTMYDLRATYLQQQCPCAESSAGVQASISCAYASVRAQGSPFCPRGACLTARRRLGVPALVACLGLSEAVCLCWHSNTLLYCLQTQGGPFLHVCCASKCVCVLSRCEVPANCKEL
jgi:hypothetical protein